MKNQNYPIQYVVPKEKGLACIDGVGIVKGRPNLELAEFFLDTILDAKVQAGLSQDLYQGPINGKTDLPAEIKAKCNCERMTARTSPISGSLIPHPSPRCARTGPSV